MEKVIDRDYISNSLLSIISDVSNISINDKNMSLFSLNYNLSSEDFVYILLIASKKLQFVLNDEFLDMLTVYSYNELINAIILQKESNE